LSISQSVITQLFKRFKCSLCQHHAFSLVYGYRLLLSVAYNLGAGQLLLKLTSTIAES